MVFRSLYLAACKMGAETGEQPTAFVLESLCVHYSAVYCVLLSENPHQNGPRDKTS